MEAGESVKEVDSESYKPATNPSVSPTSRRQTDPSVRYCPPFSGEL
jgi:hypothetical protein